jgi:hypothetical protein
MKKMLFLGFVLTALIMCKEENIITHSQWPQYELEIPYLIREPLETQTSKSDSTYILWLERRQVILKEGYSIKYNEGLNNENFKFYCEINIDNSNLWKLCKDLIRSNITGHAYIVTKFHDDEIRYGENRIIKTIIKEIDKIETDILNNCSVSFGVVDALGSLVEIYVDESKYIQFWGSDLNSFTESMNRFNLKASEDLKFVDEYLKVVYDWNFINSEAMSNQELVSYLHDI